MSAGLHDAAQRFARDTAEHQMTVAHDDGLYRHVRFATPPPGSGLYWFDLVTWPGYLAFTGDMDGYTFARVDDMFAFFRYHGDHGGGINPGYWAEKIVDGPERARAYSEERFRQLVIERAAECIRYADAPRGLARAVREMLDDSDVAYEDDAREVLEAFEYKRFRFTDTWEWDLSDWDWTYLWCCHAIRWGIAQYDAWVAYAYAVEVG